MATLSASTVNVRDAAPALRCTPINPYFGARAEGLERRTAADLTDRLQHLGQENRRLLERAIAIQSRVIETIAGAALPRGGSGAYGAAGRPAAGRQPPAIAMATRI